MREELNCILHSGFVGIKLIGYIWVIQVLRLQRSSRGAANRSRTCQTADSLGMLETTAWRLRHDSYDVDIFNRHTGSLVEQHDCCCWLGWNYTASSGTVALPWWMVTPAISLITQGQCALLKGISILIDSLCTISLLALSVTHKIILNNILFRYPPTFPLYPTDWPGEHFKSVLLHISRSQPPTYCLWKHDVVGKCARIH